MPRALVKMQAAPGSTVVSFASALYRVAADGTIEVPEEAVKVLLSHGYTEIDEPLVKMPRGRPRKVPAEADAVQVVQPEQMEL